MPREEGPSEQGGRVSDVTAAYSGSGHDTDAPAPGDAGNESEHGDTGAAGSAAEWAGDQPEVGLEPAPAECRAVEAEGAEMPEVPAVGSGGRDSVLSGQREDPALDPDEPEDSGAGGTDDRCPVDWL